MLPPSPPAPRVVLGWTWFLDLLLRFHVNFDWLGFGLIMTGFKIDYGSALGGFGLSLLGLWLDLGWLLG